MVARAGNDSSNDPFAGLLDHLALSSCGCVWRAGGTAAITADGTAGLLSPQAMPDDPDRVAILGIIDHAIPFAHRDLTTASGHSRVASVWMQGAAAADGCADLPFGRELSGAGIDRLRHQPGGRLGDEAIYRRSGALSYRRDGAMPGRLGPGLAAQVSHGSAVTGLAAGLPPDHADGRSLPVIAVSLPDHLVADTSGAFAPFFVQAAIVYIVSRARRLAAALRAAGRCDDRPVPLIVNLSYGVTAGPRDGSLGLEQLQELIARDVCDDLEPVHFVLPSGNHRLARLHGQIQRGGTVGWQIPPDDPTPNVVEIWGPRMNRPTDQTGIELSLDLPGGQTARTEFGGNANGISKLMAGGAEIARVYRQVRRIHKRQTGETYWRQCVTVIAAPTTPQAAHPGCGRAPAGLWQITLTDGPRGPFEIDVQRDDRLPTFPGARRQSRLYDSSYRDRDRTGHVQGDDGAAATAVVRRRGTSNAYASGKAQVRVGGSVGGDGIAEARVLSVAGAGGSTVAGYTGLLRTGQPGDVLAPSDRSVLLPGIPVSGCLSGSRGVLSGTSVAAPQVAKWLAFQILDGASLPDRAAVIAAVKQARQKKQPPRGR